MTGKVAEAGGGGTDGPLCKGFKTLFCVAANEGTGRGEAERGVRSVTGVWGSLKADGCSCPPQGPCNPPAAGDPPGPTRPGAKAYSQKTTLLKFCMSPYQGAPWAADPPPASWHHLPCANPLLVPILVAGTPLCHQSHPDGSPWGPSAATTQRAAAGSRAPWGPSHPARPSGGARTRLALAMGSPAASLCRHPQHHQLQVLGSAGGCCFPGLGPHPSPHRCRKAPAPASVGERSCPPHPYTSFHHHQHPVCSLLTALPCRFQV